MEKITREDVLNDNDLKGHFYGSNYNPFVVKLFEKFSLYKDHPTTASGSVAAPKPNLETENARLRQAYDYILASRNNVDKELNEANAELAAAKESIRELIPIIETILDTRIAPKRYGEIVSRAKALLDKQ